MKAAVPGNEAERLQALRQYGILDTPPEQHLDDITLLAAHICGTPTALISLIDAERQWFKSRVGWGDTESSRDVAFCAHAILDPGRELVVEDATRDRRFRDNPLVTQDPPHVRFYAGVPLVTVEGHALGTLCVLDRVPRTITAEQLAALRALRRSIVTELELRRSRADLQRTTSELSALTKDLDTRVGERTASLEAANRAVRENEERLRLATEAGRIGTWDWDIEANKVRWDPFLLRLFGFDAAQLSVDVEAWFARVHPDDRQRVRTALRKAITEQALYAEEFRIVRAEGEVRWIAAEGRAYGDAPDRAIRMVGVARDITERQRADEAAREANLRLSLAAKAGRVGLWDWNIAGGSVYFSPAWKAQLGYLDEELPNHLEEWESRLHPDDRDRTLNRIQAYLADPWPDYQAEFRLRHKDGSYRWIYTRAELLRDTMDKAQRMLGCHIDITERVLAERWGAAEKQIFELIARSASLASVLDTLCVAFESQLPQGASCSVLLLEADGIHVRHGAAPSLPDRYVAAIDGSAIGPAAGSCGTAAYLGKQVIVSDIATDPRWRDYRELALRNGLRACWSTPIFSDTGKVLATFAVYYRDRRAPDESELKLIERATNLASIALAREYGERALREHADRLKGLSQRLMEVEEVERRSINRELHDRIGQNLSALNLNLNLIRSGLSKESVLAAKARLDDVQRLVEETTAHVRNVMADLHPPALDDYGLLAALRTYVETRTARTMIPVHVGGEEPSSRPPRTVEMALFRIAQEALNNALKHARPSRIDITLATEGGRMTLAIADDGKGVDPARSDGEGRSWGLTIMRERAEAIGARLRIESEAGRGTRVVVELSQEAG